MTTKRRKLFAIILLAVIGGVITYSLLRQDNEPKYQGRRLSEWLAKYSDPKSFQDVTEGEAAVRNIGTNALPCLIKWMDYEPSEWRLTLRNKLPSLIVNFAPIDNWLVGARRRAYYAAVGFRLLRTDAVSAIPELDAMMKCSAKPYSSIQAIYALGHIGVPAIPVLKAAFANTNRSDRVQIIYAVEWMPWTQVTNDWVPTFREALKDHDLRVRHAAANYIERHAPELLTNAPPE